MEQNVALAEPGGTAPHMRINTQLGVMTSAAVLTRLLFGISLGRLADRIGRLTTIPETLRAAPHLGKGG